MICIKYSFKVYLMQIKIYMMQSNHTRVLKRFVAKARDESFLMGRQVEKNVSKSLLSEAAEKARSQERAALHRGRIQSAVLFLSLCLGGFSFFII